MLYVEGNPTRMAFAAFRMHFTMRKVVLESRPVLISSRKSTLAGPTIISPAVQKGPNQAHDMQMSRTVQLKAGASNDPLSVPACILPMPCVGLLQGGDLW